MTAAKILEISQQEQHPFILPEVLNVYKDSWGALSFGIPSEASES